MANAALRQRAAQQRGGRGAGVVSYPAPVGGRNARDAQDAMPPTDALSLINLFPDVGKVTLRKGYTSHATSVGSGNVDTLLTFDDGDSEVLLAAESSAIYNVTTAGSAPLLSSGYTNARWQGVMFNGQLGMLNGADTPIKYDGASITVMAASGSGLTNTDLIGGIAYKARTFFWEKRSGNNPRAFWYSAVNTLGGALTKFDVSQEAGFGGNITTMGVWSRDAGDGLDDYLAIFMSDGTITVWNGTNPGDTSAWSHVGTYKTGEPLGIRGLVRRGGELIIMTKAGYLPLNAIIQGGTSAVALSDKIFGDVRDNATNYAGNFGWDAIEHPSGKAIYFNIPVSDTTFYQDVVNMTAPVNREYPWALFQGMNARCWGQSNGNLFFGSYDGTVYQADTGTDDDGSAINATGKTSFQHLSPRGTKARATGVEPQLRATAGGSFSYSAGVDVDFKDQNLAPNLYTVTSDQKNWEDYDDVTWDTWIDNWESSIQFIDNWLSVFGHGSTFAGRIQLSSSNETVEWLATVYAFEAGGPV